MGLQALHIISKFSMKVSFRKGGGRRKPGGGLRILPWNKKLKILQTKNYR